MSKGFKRYIPIWLVLFVTTIVLAEILPVEKSELFTTVYFFIVIAYIIELFIASRALNNKQKEVGQPIFIYSVLGVVMVFAANWWLIAKQHYHKTWFYIMVNIIVLALHYVFLLLVDASLKQNVERDKHVNEKTDTMLSLTKQVKALYDTTNNKDIYRLYEALKYANKSSRADTRKIDEQIKEKIGSISFDDEKEIQNQVNEAIRLIKEKEAIL